MTPTNLPTVTPRGRCPVCKRSVAVLSDGRVGYPHRHGLAGCKGLGEMALPLDAAQPGDGA